MSWRVVVVSRRCKLEYKLGYLVCRGEEVKKIFMAEIGTLIIESTAVCMTAALLCELVKGKINVVICDEKHNPQSQIIALSGRHNSSGCLKRQVGWDDGICSDVWAEIVRSKILKQRDLLYDVGYSEQAAMLEQYAGNVLAGDATNREGHAAKVYFNVIFGNSFKRGDANLINAALNYGYAIILSAFNREIVSDGYDTRLGIAHKNEFNAFNLSCDLMEPFRVLVDRYVRSTAQEMSAEYKHSLCNILNNKVRIGGEENTVSSAISIYCKSVFEAIEANDKSKIKCYEL